MILVRAMSEHCARLRVVPGKYAEREACAILVRALSEKCARRRVVLIKETAREVFATPATKLKIVLRL